MKKKVILLLAALLCLLCLLALTACDEGGDVPDGDQTEQGGGEEIRHTHNLTHHASEASTCDRAGCVEYWSCTECEMYFSDASATTEITDKTSVLLPTLAHIYNTGNVCTVCNTALQYTEGLEYTLNADGVSYSVKKGTATAADIVIPPYHEEKPVTNIDRLAFYNGTLTSISIPASIRSIGYRAFGGCFALSSVYISDLEAWCNIGFGDIGNPLTNGADLYLNGYKITSLKIPNTVTKINSNSFNGCKSIIDVSIPEGVIDIGYAAFNGCRNLTTISIPCSVKSIGSNAFCECIGLTSITIPESVTSIGEGAFYYCYRLSSISIPGMVTNIEKNTFFHCVSLVSMSFGANSQLKAIGDYAFSGCSGLTSIKIPTNVTSIGKFAFEDCSGLSSIDIPTGVTSIGGFAFSGCSGLTSIDIPTGVTGIEEYTFEGCKSLTSVTMHSGVKRIGNYAFSGCSGLTSIDIPTSVTSIGGYAFSGCSGLTSIDIPTSVTSIGGYAFSGCSGLTSIDIPTGVTGIEEYTFKGCKSLTSVMMHSGVKRIGNYAFSDCRSLTSITIPSGVTSIGDYAFDWCGLATVNFEAGSLLESIGDHAFGACSGLIDIDLELANQLKTISEGAFYNCDRLTSITIPAATTRIESYAFRGCDKLIEVYNLSNLSIEVGSENYGMVGLNAKIIHTSASAPSKLLTDNNGYIFFDDGAYRCLIDYRGTETALNLPANCQGNPYEIYLYAFSGGEMTSVTIPVGVTGIGNNAFYYCDNLQSITIPSSVVNIGEAAFAQCYNLTTVNFEENSQLTTLSSRAFSYCEKLTSVALPASLTSIGERAFSSCLNLTSVTIPANVSSIGNSAFVDCYKLVEIYNLSTLSIAVGSEAYGQVGKYAKIIHSAITEQSNLFVDGNGYVFYDDGTNHYLMDYRGNNTALVLPEKCNGNTYEIHQYAFYMREELTSISISDFVTGIGEAAFGKCYGVPEIVIPASVTYIGNGAFYEGGGGSFNVTFAEDSQLLSIGESAFGDTALDTITIPESVVYIGRKAFERVNSVIFENTTGWSVAGTSISAEDLLDAETAAEYLRSTYSKNAWTRN